MSTRPEVGELGAAVVIGAGGGIGRGVAEALLERSTKVLAVDVDTGKLDALRADHPGDSGLEIMSADVADPASADRIVSEAVARIGGLDGLVNCVGIFPRHSAFEVTTDSWRRTLEVNLTGQFFPAQAAAKVMAKQGHGAIVHVSSLSARKPRPGRLEYSVTKAGVDQLTRCLAMELAPLGIRVNAVAPSHIDTDMISFVHQSRDTLDSVVAGIPIGRLGSVHDVVHAILFLLSDRAGFITGEVLSVDGGLAHV
jgi:NAD(P)-dependent dehydrogenase (short-subunit alcohol dehydrogenase family)